MNLQKAVFFDRDGVLNHAVIKDEKPYPPSSLAELIITDGATSDLASLKKAGFLLIGVTNQPDVARGTTLQSTVEAINQSLLQQLPLDEILVCYHDDYHQCHCRKPLPGLLTTSAEKYHIDLAHSFMIGDRWRDIEAGQRAGCKTILIDYNYAEKKAVSPDFTTTSLSTAVEWILRSNL